MSTAETFGAVATSAEPKRPSTSANETTTRVKTLGELAGAHPDALRAIYRAGKATNPEELGRSPSGLFLAVEPTREVHFLVKPILAAVSNSIMPWRGKVFSSDGTGKNIVFGGERIAFAFERGISDIDGGETLVIRYDHPEHKNVWPVRNIRDELRTVAKGVAIGPALFSAKAFGERKVLLWFGLTAQ